MATTEHAEKTILDLIRNHHDPEQALLTAIAIITDFMLKNDI